VSVSPAHLILLLESDKSNWQACDPSSLSQLAKSSTNSIDPIKRPTLFAAKVARLPWKPPAREEN